MGSVRHIRNPLTIIAIFAGITEVTGAAVLPFLTPETQAVFVWFLASFPFVLILLFFATLNFNHKVLYAPSDYADEENFMRWFDSAGSEERIRKLQSEAGDTTEYQNDQEHRREKADGDARTEESGAATDRVNLHKAIRKSRHGNYLLAEELVLRSMCEKTGIKYQRNMVFRAGDRRFIIDAVGEMQDGKLVGVEIKFVHELHLAHLQVKKWLQQLQLSYDRATGHMRSRLQFVLAVVVERGEEKEPVRERVAGILSDPAVPVELEVFALEELETRYL